MAGFTESPFRRMVREIEPSVVLVSELISAEALRRGSKKTLEMCRFHPDEKNKFGIQLFGGKLESFCEAARVVADLGVDFIDLNFGCPSPKILKSGAGSALLRDPDRVADLIAKMTKITSLPITAKMRLGFFDDENCVPVAKKFESAGLASLAIHGRTTAQKFAGIANWQKIYEVKNSLKIPVIGNGDIRSATDAIEKLKNLDGIMIGRAAIDNPWIFRECRAIFDKKPAPPAPTLQEKIEFFRKHARRAVEFKGSELPALRECRKHFARLARGIPRASHFRDRLVRVENLAELDRIFDEILENSHKSGGAR